MTTVDRAVGHHPEASTAVPRAVTEHCGGVYIALTGLPVEADGSICSTDLIHGNGRGHAIVAAYAVNALAGRIAR